MKICYKIIVFLLAMTALTSCQKWLDVKPQNEQVSDLYWSNKEEVEAVLGSAYVKLQESLQTMLVWGEARGNTLALGGFVNVDLLRLKSFSLVPTNEFVKWGNFYQVINYANMVLKYAPSVVEKDPSFNQAAMQSFLSEAYFLRALSYFYLVRSFGEAPLILEPYMNDAQAHELPKSTKQQIFEQITFDLTTALSNSKEVWPTVWETKGRSTKWAIHALLADAYLWVGEYDKAIISCNAILESGKYGLLQGTVNNKNNWFNIFAQRNSNEGIFEIQFDQTKGQTNDLVAIFGTSYNWVVSPYMVSVFDQSSEDIRGAGATYQTTDWKLWKYLGAEGNTSIPRPFSDQNWIIYRMADVYLMKAEALIMKGETYFPQALELVRAIRMRAGVTQPLDAENTEVGMLHALLQERAKEFVGEGKNWFDLLRVAQRDEYRYKDYFIEQVVLGVSGASTPVIRSQLMNVHAHYLPIHADELRNNKLLVQNPYYENLN